MEKRQIYRKFCMNCGRHGHMNKYCNDPITSIGFILFSINESNIRTFLKKPINIKYFNNKFNRINIGKIILNNNKNIISNLDNKTVDFLGDNIKFLLVQRRHSIGFIDFIRGRYEMHDILHLIYLFKQMTPNEVRILATIDFEEIWQSVWFPCKKYGIIDSNIIEYSSDEEDYYDYDLSDELLDINDIEYINSRIKFEELNNKGMLHILFNIDCDYDEPEWGFPKGRRCGKENNIECAMRELFEETNLASNDYTILNGIFPLTEIMTGTNNILYKHIYYLGTCSEINTQDIIKEITDKQIIEISQVKLFSYNQAIQLIRPYHIEKRKILDLLFSFVVKQLTQQKNIVKTNNFISI